ncbi:MAG TPA: carboxypeptidase regulatory-like domain-containing protein [Vicinamibacterales bacterium]|nr:carboxypeptidase regulatory-like domain-containing protein [Vicinamibacterales bacterium]
MQTVSLLILLSAACSRSEPAATSSAPPTPPAATPAALAPGTVSGKVPGFSPGALAIVILDPKTPREFAPPTDAPIMDQVGQTFGPAVLFVQTGQPVEFRNSDDTLHNVHVSNEDTREGAFNVAIPTGNSYRYTFKQDGFYHVGCDIHPSMSAEIISTSTPFATTATDDGGYEFVDVPPGQYRLTIYMGGKKTQSDVEITAPQSRGTPTPE